MDVDDLVGQLSEAKVDPTALGQHPRFCHYKNATRAAEQQANRRREALERQQDRRSNAFNRMRKLANESQPSDDDEELEDEEKETDQAEPVDLSTPKENAKHKSGYRKNRYADQLMLSEWLVDIPEKLTDTWIMIPAPVGRRTLVVASKGVTTAYAKSGKLIHQFSSHLPSRGSNKFTILDCILSNNVFYCIDLLAWNGLVHYDDTFELRRFLLHSHITDEPLLGQPSKYCKFVFKPLPQTFCQKAPMEQMLSSEFEYDVDGFLFYYSQVLYEAGQSPLVGWLKPFMLPELLGVQVPQKFLDANEEKLSSHDFINKFNKKHKHTSKISKDAEMDE